MTSSEQEPQRTALTLPIEIDRPRMALQVSEIVDAPGFRILLSRARALRAKRSR
jgi:hypothetical protein